MSSFAFSNTRVKPYGTERVHWATVTIDSVETACGLRPAKVKAYEVRQDVNCPRCLKRAADQGQAQPSAAGGAGRP